MYRNGAKRCGLYCAANYILETLRVDNEVNVFMGVRCVSLSRPEFIQTLVCIQEIPKYYLILI